MSPPTLSSMARNTARGNERDFLTLARFFNVRVNTTSACAVLIFGRRGRKVKPSPTERRSFDFRYLAWARNRGMNVSLC
jgi:hypothetical protein